MFWKTNVCQLFGETVYLQRSLSEQRSRSVHVDVVRDSLIRRLTPQGPFATKSVGGLGEALMKTLSRVVFLVVGVLLLNNCGGSGSSSTPPVPTLKVASGTPPAANLMVSYGQSGAGFVLSASGGVSPYTWSWAPATGSSLPPGLTLTNDTILGTPTTLGSYSVVVTVSDTEAIPQRVNTSYTITVTPAPLAIVTTSLPGATINVLYYRHCRINGLPCRPPFLYGLQLAASGGVSPYTWTWAPAAGSSLPPGMTFSAGGLLNGIPTATGTYNLVFTVTDSQSPAAQATANLSLNVHYPPPPSISTNPGPPASRVNLPYSFTFSASGTGPLTWAETGALPSGLTFASGLLSGTPTATGSFPITLEVQDRYGQNSAPQNFTVLISAHGFEATGSMATARVSHTATLLQNGKVLVVGGKDPTGISTVTAEIYDPASGTFTSTTGNMAVGRFSHTATLLTNGKVLIAGGIGTGPSTTITAELFDPTTGTFSATSAGMTAVRTAHTATLLTNGQVLLVGGTDISGTAQQTAELFDPASGTFTATTGKMGTARAGQTATLLSSGKVLVAGGVDAAAVPVATAELFDPSTGTFTATTVSMSVARAQHTATFLPASGKVLIAGGLDSSGNPEATAELFDPNAGTFTATASPMITPRYQHNANLLADGTVLVTGGSAGAGAISLAEVFDPTSTSFSQTGSMTIERFAAASVLLTDGRVLVTGGGNTSGLPDNLADLYQ